MLGAGDFDRRVTILQASVAKDATYGHEVATWATFATRWARVVQTAAMESQEGAERVSRRRFEITLRRLVGLLPTMRVQLADGSVLKIDGIVDSPDRIDPGHVLTCEETTP
jgi:head-tail adaptor